MYDIIGDTHGHAKKLDQLLVHMDYPLKGNRFFPHPEGRKLWFAGDLVNRGPDSIENVQRVEALVTDDIAEAIIGNHDYDTVLWATPHPYKPGEFLQPHIESEYGERHAFRKQLIDNPALCQSIVAWFKTLPLYLERDNYRLVHACWHQQSIDLLKQNDCMTKDGRLTEKGWLTAADPDSPLQKAIDILLKGPQEKLGAGLAYLDWDGQKKETARVAWWKEDATFVSEAFSRSCFQDISPFAAIPYKQDSETPITQEIRAGLRDLPANVKIFIGHIWEPGDPQPLSDKVACVDYGSGAHGKLVAYRTVPGETDLQARNFFWVPAP